MGSSRDLPVAERVRVGLTDAVARGRLALGVQHHHRDPEIVAQQVDTLGNPGTVRVRHIGLERHHRVAHLERGTAAEVHDQEEGVETTRERLHAVQVGGQPGC